MSMDREKERVCGVVLTTMEEEDISLTDLVVATAHVACDNVLKRREAELAALLTDSPEDEFRVRVVLRAKAVDQLVREVLNQTEAVAMDRPLGPWESVIQELAREIGDPR